MTTLEVSIAAGRPPLVAAEPGRSAPAVWVAEHREELDRVVARHGAALVRGLGARDPATAATVSRALLTELMPEREPFAPRPVHWSGLYASTAWPADQPMCMHHELSYALEFPGRQLFFCLTAPTGGGATALADAGAVLRDLPSDLVQRFDRQGWELLRVHNGVVGVPWPAAFGTDDRASVERYCQENDVQWCWDGDGGLRTRRRRRAVLHHPVTGERLWFNQIAFLNEWTMEPAVRDYLTLEFGADGLPFNTRYGDGEPLDKRTVDLINDVYAAHAVRAAWQAGDVLVVDNVKMAHGRDPYQGERQILVALGDPVRPAGTRPRSSDGQSKLRER